MTHRPSSRLLSALQTHSDVLQRLTTDFRFQLPQYHIASFYEQRPMKLFSGLVRRTLLISSVQLLTGVQIVEQHSALLEAQHEEQIPINADHSAMCKFKADSDDTFEKVYKRIRRMRTDPRPRATNQNSTSR
ncbi:hypothetical protein GJ744_007627 [Endocarpon pusillum]|uniref:Uncharacterized protein n=1 Tax=Endocarpon pusillum TaxID=364733 RepID=A0A8H7E3X2_9EURO|nr:hypothetical protein GJ744_007627 [Endocarpon pusillum]